MTTLLSTHDVQELLNIDRSTVYRMADDGRLTGVKVGRQWRFAADRIAEQLGLALPPIASRPPSGDRGGSALSQLLVPSVAQSIADLLGDLFGVMAVVADMDGRPLTEVANPCGFYSVIADEISAERACSSEWRQFAEEPRVAPHFVQSHLGFLCARTFIWVDLEPVGMLVVGGVTPAAWPPDEAFIEGIADEVGVAPVRLEEVVHETWHVDLADQRWIEQMLPQIGDLVSQLASARSHFLAHFDAVAAPATALRTKQRTTS